MMEIHSVQVADLSRRRMMASSYYQILVVTFATFSIAAAARPEGWQIDKDIYPAPVSGLDYAFYVDTCPDLESIVLSRVGYFLNQSIGEAAGLLRLFFHDCFVIGCDASVLLINSTSGPSETSAIPNLTLRPSAFNIINDIKEHVEASCPGIVSCADIVALAARDAVFKAGGAWFPMPTGRRDNKNSATLNVTLASLPAPTANVTVLLEAFKNKSLNVVDLVALSGGHTIGLAHCASLTRLFPTQDATLDSSFASSLLSACPNSTVNNTVNNDRITPNVFDNFYYVDLINNSGLFVSDQSLYTDARTKQLVIMFVRQRDLFQLQFAISAIKMGMLGVLTGTDGEIRLNCSVPNPTSSSSSSSFPSPGSTAEIVDEDSPFLSSTSTSVHHENDSSSVREDVSSFSSTFTIPGEHGSSSATTIAQGDESVLSSTPSTRAHTDISSFSTDTSSMDNEDGSFIDSSSAIGNEDSSPLSATIVFEDGKIGSSSSIIDNILQLEEFL